MFEKILLVLDGSKYGESAIPYAESLTKALNARLLLLHLKKHTDDSEAYTEQVSSQIASDLGQMKLKTAEVVGEASIGIINYAEQNGAGLIIIATHSRSGILLWPTGNIATRVLEGVTMPVLSIKAEGACAGDIETMVSRILVPLDGSKPGEAALPYAAALARRLKSELVLLNVVEPGQHVHTVGGLSYVRFLPEQVDRLKAEAEKYLSTVAQSVTGVKTVTTRLLVGMPTQGIPRVGDQECANLIALSTTGHKGAFGSVFRKVIQSAHCHVMAVRPPLD